MNSLRTLTLAAAMTVSSFSVPTLALAKPLEGSYKNTSDVQAQHADTIIINDSGRVINLTATNPELARSIEDFARSLGEVAKSLSTIKSIEINDTIELANLDKELQKLNRELEKVDAEAEKSDNEEAAEALENLQEILADIQEEVTEGYADTANTDSLGKRKTDTTEIKIGNTRVVIIGEPKIEKIYTEEEKNNDEEGYDHHSMHSKHHKKHDFIDTDWFGMDLGFNSFVDNNSLSLSAKNKDLELVAGKSVNFQLRFFTTSVSLYRNYVNFVYGLGLDYNNYRFSQPIILVPKQATLTILRDSADGKPVSYQKNKLVSNYITIPVMLMFQSKNKESWDGFHLAVGGELGYLLNAHTKRVLDIGQKVKDYDDFNLQKLRYGLVGRIGFDGFSVYGKYYLSNVFAQSQGPKLNTFCVGLALTGF